MIMIMPYAPPVPTPRNGVANSLSFVRAHGSHKNISTYDWCFISHMKYETAHTNFIIYRIFNPGRILAK